MTKRLKGKIALVTGGSRGIGAAIASRLAEEGAAVAITYVNGKQRADALVEAIKASGGNAIAIHADSADDTEMNPAEGPFAETMKSFMALERYGRGDEIAAMVAYLAGPEAGFVTGASLTIDGGYSA